ncbi:MAG: hypothetical protein OEZ02_07705 [Anaerolineae bacterium]|nr:hypothetical protein [Anaerolineae bacterium]
MEFPQSVIEKLNFYVYILIDPRTEEIFYVGKGNGNRIFAHLNSALNNPQKSDKLNQIRKINKAGKVVKHIVLRHGLTEKEAFEVEAATIDLLGLKGLTNIVAGHESDERGWMTAIDIISEFAAKKINIVEPSILITVNKQFRYGMSPDELYEITRGNWIVAARREDAEYAISVYRGVVRQVYKIHSWSHAEARNEAHNTRDRWRFDGEIADDLFHYIGGEVGHYVKKGNQNPIHYLNC